MSGGTSSKILPDPLARHADASIYIFPRPYPTPKISRSSWTREKNTSKTMVLQHKKFDLGHSCAFRKGRSKVYCFKATDICTRQQLPPRDFKPTHRGLALQKYPIKQVSWRFVANHLLHTHGLMVERCPFIGLVHDRPMEVGMKPYVPLELPIIVRKIGNDGRRRRLSERRSSIPSLERIRQPTNGIHPFHIS